MSDQEDFASLLGEFERQRPTAAQREPKVGEKVSGRIVSIQGDSVFVDLGAKTEGIVDIEELTGEDGALEVQVGDSIEIAVSGKDEASGALLLGARHAHATHGSAGLRQAYEEQQPVEGVVSGVTKGGLEVEISGARAFCPASQIDIRYVEDLQEFIGQKLAFRITKIESGRKLNLVVSRRSLLEEEQRLRAVETRAQLQEGAVLSGRVSSLKPFGAFIDLGGIEGMVHVSELAFGRVEHPQELLTLGQQVEVMVLGIEQTDNPRQPERIALSIRALEQDPWLDAVTDYPVGSQVEGVVSRLQPFGAFVELAPGVDGLVHISELGAGRRIGHPQEVVSVGDRVQARVLSVDTDKHRIGLSLNADQPLQAGESGQRGDRSTSAAYSPGKPSFGTLGDLLKESMKKSQ